MLRQLDSFGFEFPSPRDSIADILPLVTNSHGQIRRILVFRAFMSGKITLSDVIAIFQLYVSENEYICLYGTGRSEIYRCVDGVDVSFFEEPQWLFVKASKRGNDVYRRRVNDRFSWLNNVEDVKFFNNKKRGLASTPLLFITLTYASSRCSIEDAWLNIGSEYNAFVSNLRASFGKISILRSWEVLPDGYPHVHLLIFFHDYSFPVHRSARKKDGKLTYRIPFSLKNKIAGFWHSFVDIQGCYSAKGSVGYVVKYITKDLFGGANKTAALLWLFGARSYSCPPSFIESVFSVENTRLDYNMHNSKYSYIFIGIFSNSVLHFHPSKWFLAFEKPPPRIMPAILQAFAELN